MEREVEGKEEAIQNLALIMSQIKATIQVVILKRI